MNNKGPISQFMEKHYRHFNAAALMDAAKGYETHLTRRRQNDDYACRSYEHSGVGNHHLQK